MSTWFIIYIYTYSYLLCTYIYICTCQRSNDIHVIYPGLPSDVDVSNFFSVATCNPWTTWMDQGLRAKAMLVDVYFGTRSITFIIYITISLYHFHKNYHLSHYIWIHIYIYIIYIYHLLILGIIRIHELRIAVVSHGDTRRACRGTGMSQWCPCAMAMFVGLW